MIFHIVAVLVYFDWWNEFEKNAERRCRWFFTFDCQWRYVWSLNESRRSRRLVIDFHLLFSRGLVMLTYMCNNQDKLLGRWDWELFSMALVSRGGRKLLNRQCCAKQSRIWSIISIDHTKSSLATFRYLFRGYLCKFTCTSKVYRTVGIMQSWELSNILMDFY